MSITIYGAILSPFVRKVLALASEKGISVTLTPGGMGQGGDAFAAASPFAKMPAMCHAGAAADGGDYLLSDSSAICHYLDAAFGGPTLIPADPQQRGEVVWLDEFSDTILGVTGGKMFFNRIVLPRFMRRDGDLAAADDAEQVELPRIVDWLERRVAGRTFLVGDTVTLADLAVAIPFANIAGAGFSVDPATHPELHRWLADITARPSLARIQAKVGETLARTAA